MPEPDSGHYINETLNKAFVYTNISDITINEEMAKGYITIHTSKRIASYKPINLNSVYRLRQRERTRLSPKFNSIFLTVANKYNLKSKIILNDQSVRRGLIVDANLTSIDELVDTVIESNFTVSINNDDDLQKIFDAFIRKNLEPFHPEDLSVGRLKESIYGFFATSVGMEYSSDQISIINIALSDNNVEHFVNVIDESKASYISDVETREKELIPFENWNIPQSINYTANEVSIDSKKSVMLPFYSATSFKTELAFIEYLEAQSKVEWWFKNGERDATFFAVSYIENGQNKLFYVDFIVKLKNGKIGLLDTKRGQTVKLSGEKSDGLQTYLSKYKNLYGGIIDNTKEDFSGRWMVYNGAKEDLVVGDFSNWVLLEFN